MVNSLETRPHTSSAGSTEASVEQLEMQYTKPYILVIDDSEELLELEKTILEMEGFDVLTAQSGLDALAILAKMAPPQLMLVDVNMDGMSGPELVRLLVSGRPNLVAKVPIVFLTADDQIPMQHAHGYIQKPFAIDKFVAAVRHFIRNGTTTSCYQ